jgi:DNA processing protein
MLAGLARGWAASCLPAGMENRAGVADKIARLVGEGLWPYMDKEASRRAAALASAGQVPELTAVLEENQRLREELAAAGSRQQPGTDTPGPVPAPGQNFFVPERPGPAEREARAVLTYLAEAGDPDLNRLISICGSAGGALTVILEDSVPAEMRQRPGWAHVAGKVETWASRIGTVPPPGFLDGFAELGIRAVCPGDPEWPSRLDGLGDRRPYALWANGALTAAPGLAADQSVTVTGTGAPTSYGSWAVSDLVSALAPAGGRDQWTVITGGTPGIETAAARQVIAAGGTAVEVLAQGIDAPARPGHADLADDTRHCGVLISEWPPRQRAAASPARRKRRTLLLAALPAAVIVVEAERGGPPVATARQARELGRLVMAVPGPVTSAESAGCHVIIGDMGGTLIRDGRHAVSLLGSVRGPGPDPAPGTAALPAMRAAAPRTPRIPSAARRRPAL